MGGGGGKGGGGKGGGSSGSGGGYDWGAHNERERLEEEARLEAIRQAEEAETLRLEGIETARLATPKNQQLGNAKTRKSGGSARLAQQEARTASGESVFTKKLEELQTNRLGNDFTIK